MLVYMGLSQRYSEWHITYLDRQFIKDTVNNTWKWIKFSCFFIYLFFNSLCYLGFLTVINCTGGCVNVWKPLQGERSNCWFVFYGMTKIFSSHLSLSNFVFWPLCTERKDLWKSLKWKIFASPWVPHWSTSMYFELIRELGNE